MRSPLPFSSWSEDEEEEEEIELSREFSLVGDAESPVSTSVTRESSGVAVLAVMFSVATVVLLVLLLFVDVLLSLAVVAMPMSLLENTLQLPVVISIIIIFLWLRQCSSSGIVLHQA